MSDWTDDDLRGLAKAVRDGRAPREEVEALEKASSDLLRSIHGPKLGAARNNLERMLLEISHSCQLVLNGEVVL